MATILIVDDDPTGLQYLDTLLGYQGHRMVKAGGANEALTCCRAGKPDLIITDVLMPELDGYQFVRELRKDKDLADISVIFYTATYYRGKNSLALARACGVARVLSKPAEPDTILEAVNAVLENPGVSTQNLSLQEFDRDHARLIGSKLFNNVRKLDEANAQLRASEEQLRRLADHLRSAQEDERKRIARHLHDELGQALTLLKMNCSWIEGRLRDAPEGVIARLRSSIQLADDTISSVRRVATELRPAILDLGIAAAIEWQAESFQARTNIECAADLQVDDESIAPETATELFRILQEALTNVLRHAEATEIHISLRREDNCLVLEIRDNGKGIGEERIANGKTLGLLGMRERAALVGGFLSVEGGEGTTVRVYIPQQPAGVLQ
ncbi:MAG TPA: response regulator [Bryobacteraceae bacterium]|jgi:signal transduction histidine kinase|nr:response regulator [Bryobacteraceae bacterium]